MSDASSSQHLGLLFTAFEPSGDDHAAAVIAELRRRHPDLPIYAWGGPKMERAGATIIERTGDEAVMGMPGLAKLIEHQRINTRINRWLREGKAKVHVPVDSPGANFPICKLTRRAGLKIVHLVAPQVWAWAPWRIRKLRRLTDLVLCLLPFEEPWFMQRAVPAKFIGHPLFDGSGEEAGLDARAAAIGLEGSPKVAFMPGSRPGEFRACFPVLLDAFKRLRKDFPTAAGVVAATRPEVAMVLRGLADLHGGWPPGLEMVCGDTDAVIRWCDYALVTSGTVTLQIARQRKPMAAFYRPSKFMYHLIGRWLVTTPMFTLPNLIAGKRVIPELIPYFSDSGEDLAVEVIKFMRRTGYADDQREALQRVVRAFEGKHAATSAADQIERIAGLVAPAVEPGAAPIDLVPARA